MKKKLFMLMIAFLMFIPLTIVKADELDSIIERLNERIYFSDSYIRGIGSNISATKVDNNKLKVTVTTDMGDAYSTYPEGFIDSEEMTFTSFIIYEYQNSTLSYKGNFGYIDADENTVDYKTTDKDIWAETLAAQNEPITKELIYVLYSLKTQKSYPDITTYLKSVGLEKEDGGLLYPTTNLPEGITITKDSDEYGFLNVTEYSINLNQINIPGTTNNNNNNNNNNTNTNTDNLAGHGYATPDNNFSISFIEEFGKEFTFIVQTFSKELENNKDNETELKKINEVGDKVKAELKDNGTFIELYNITLTYNNEEKTEGKFTFRIKYTDEMKKYNTFELINIDDNLKKQDVVKMKVEGDYLVGELPHLSVYALVGKKTSNPGTGVAKYTIPGVALLLGTFGIYALYKKKTEA